MAGHSTTGELIEGLNLYGRIFEGAVHAADKNPRQAILGLSC
jgi:hypothetical protein